MQAVDMVKRYIIKVNATQVCLLCAFIALFTMWNFGGCIPFTPRRAFHAEIRPAAPYLEGDLMEEKHKKTDLMQVMQKHIAKTNYPKAKMFISLQPDIKTVTTSAEWMAQREIIYAERNKRIQEVCKYYSDLYRFPYKADIMLRQDVFWYDMRNHLSMCMHAKVTVSVDLL